MEAQKTNQYIIQNNILCKIQGIHKRMVRFQKLTKTSFRTLHGHRQRRQLSKFLMRYQQFASHAYCVAAGPVPKMALQQEKALCVIRHTQSKEFNKNNVNITTRTYSKTMQYYG
jgi:hypothetical protein